MKNIATIAKEADGYADFRARCDAEVAKQYESIADRLVDLVAAKLAEKYDIILTRRDLEPPASAFPPDPQPT
jgi:hypothetical protein